LVWF
jgi:ATP-dependent RNA helicase DDX6/DHH1